MSKTAIIIMHCLNEITPFNKLEYLENKTNTSLEAVLSWPNYVV